MVAQKSRACAACLQVQQELAEGAKVEPQTIVCHFGLCDTAVPVRLGEQLIGFPKTRAWACASCNIAPASSAAPSS